MKKYILIIVGLTFFTSCKKYLDVQPQSQIDETKLFSSDEGFREALNGVYDLCAAQSLYGGNLTFGSFNGTSASGGLDVLVGDYQFQDAISQDIEAFDYKQQTFIATTNTIWDAGYQAISNCNYILAAIDSKKSLFTGNDYQLIKGEALALRAYLHFDLLRMFAPSFASKPNASAIPYVTQVTVNSTPFSTVKATLDKCIADLNYAQSLLKVSDPILNGYTVGYPGQSNQNEDGNADLFYQNRRHRMNYYTVCGELARVELYKGDYADALYNANLIIGSKVFPFTSQADFFSTINTKKDHIFYKELISCWYVDTAPINAEVTSLFTNITPIYSATPDQISQIYETAQVGADDWRYKQWFQTIANQTGGTAADHEALQKYVNNAAPIANLHPLVAPAMRLSEMYYIAAEASYSTGDTGGALQFFNTIRAARGIGDAVTDVPDKATFTDLLLTEARKEFYGESQVFYMYKRLNHGIPVSATVTKAPSDQIFVFPLPADELAYRNN